MDTGDPGLTKKLPEDCECGYTTAGRIKNEAIVRGTWIHVQERCANCGKMLAERHYEATPSDLRRMRKNP